MHMKNQKEQQRANKKQQKTMKSSEKQKRTSELEKLMEKPKRAIKGTKILNGNQALETRETK